MSLARERVNFKISSKQKRWGCFNINIPAVACQLGWNLFIFFLKVARTALASENKTLEVMLKKLTLATKVRSDYVPKSAQIVQTARWLLHANIVHTTGRGKLSSLFTFQRHQSSQSTTRQLHQVRGNWWSWIGWGHYWRRRPGGRVWGNYDDVIHTVTT